jgi:phage-related baseplate assembly protein
MPLRRLIPRLTTNGSTPADPTSPVTVSTPAAPEYGLPWVPDIDFVVKDPGVIEQEVIADYEAAFEALTNIAKKLGPGDPVRLTLLTVCHWLSHQRVLIDFTGKQNLLKYAHDEYLDNLAALHGDRTLRLQAQPATTTLQFTLAASLSFDVVVPKGTLCQAPNNVVFQTTDDCPIAATLLTGQVNAAATTPGVIGNDFLPGQIASVINWNQPFGVAVSNTTTTSGGSDAEDDDQYRYRIWLAIESYSTCGPRGAYEFWALSAHPDIIQCVVYSAPEIAGEVWLYPLLKNGVLPSTAILALVEAACSADTRRPVTDYVTAKLATQVAYTLDMDYYILSDNQPLEGSIVTNVNQAAQDWILWQRSNIGRDINGDELAKRCLQAGAKRIVINSPSPSFQPLNFDQLAVHNSTVAPVVNFAGLEDD